MNNDWESEIKRLNFEDFLWCIFVILSILNIISNSYQKEYVVSGDDCYEGSANNISIFVLTILLFVYLYFFIRNYKMYNKKGNDIKVVDFVKVVGSFLFILGTLCLLYFQVCSDDNYIGDAFL